MSNTRTPIAVIAVLAGACSSAPISYSGVAPPGRETAYQCAVAQLNIMNYTIEDGNADAGFVKGRKQTSGLGAQIITGNTYHDVLTATVFDNPATGETHLRVEAKRVADRDVALGLGISDEPEQGEERLAPSETGKADAQALLTSCGVGAITGQSAAGEAFVAEGVTASGPVPPGAARGFAAGR